jgi:hypothetical protein
LFASLVTKYASNLQNTKGKVKMLASQSMTLKSKILKVAAGWPIAIIIFGGALTFFWLVLLILFALHLLQVL